MFAITILASGSSGNCAVVETSKTRLLVDAGLSFRQIKTRLAAVGQSFLDFDGIVLTHEHGDHTRGLNVLLKHFPLPVYTNRATATLLRNDGLSFHRDWRLVESGGSFSIKDIDVEIFSVPHDAVDPVGLLFHNSRRAIGFLTDLGHASKNIIDRARHATTLLIETNHDETLLARDTKRPWSVKQRIMSRHGHLSNLAAASLLEQIPNDRLSRVILGHLSRDCNNPDLAIQTVRSQLNEKSLDIFCATPAEALSPIEG